MKKWIVRFFALIALALAGVIIHATISYYHPIAKDISWIEKSKLMKTELYFPPESLGQHRKE